MNEPMTPAQRLVTALFRQVEVYEAFAKDLASHPLPDYMQMARAKETLARAAAVMAEANSKS
jgi:hypothetical protein